MLQNRYRVLSLLGKGSFANVYLVDDAQWKGNPLALKEIRTDHLTDREYSQLNVLFLQEAALMMTLKHPGLPRMFDFFAEGSNYYLAMEWIAGKTLEHHVQEAGPVSETVARDWALQLADVLEFLHGQQPALLLGDLKPSNVLMQYDGRLRVIDLGLAGRVTPDSKRDFVMVSPGFSPPEQFQGHRTDERSDVYALGATLYWALTGQGLERYNFLIPPLRTRRSDVSAPLEDLLMRCLAHSPGLRFASVGHFKKALATGPGVVESGPSPSEILSSLYKGQKRKLDF